MLSGWSQQWGCCCTMAKLCQPWNAFRTASTSFLTQTVLCSVSQGHLTGLWSRQREKAAFYVSLWGYKQSHFFTGSHHWPSSKHGQMVHWLENKVRGKGKKRKQENFPSKRETGGEGLVSSIAFEKSNTTLIPYPVYITCFLRCLSFRVTLLSLYSIITLWWDSLFTYCAEYLKELF